MKTILFQLSLLQIFQNFLTLHAFLSLILIVIIYHFIDAARVGPFKYILEVSFTIVPQQTRVSIATKFKCFISAINEHFLRFVMNFLLM